MLVMGFVVFLLSQKEIIISVFIFFFTANPSSPLSSKQLQADPAVSVKIWDYHFTTEGNTAEGVLK